LNLKARNAVCSGLAGAKLLGEMKRRTREMGVVTTKDVSLPMPRTLAIETVETPLGPLLLVADSEGVLRAAEFADCEARMRRLLDRQLGHAGYELRPGPVPNTIKAALAAYFAGDLMAIERIPVNTGGTAFQNAVWSALRAIASGRTVTYSQLAHTLGKPRSARAVGHANGANPVCIVVPCHRLVGADGALTGYGGGVERKRWLLNHEAATPLR
jgi:methylated-DNA-[protein]-cysteine S-methyltransferase